MGSLVCAPKAVLLLLGADWHICTAPHAQIVDELDVRFSEDAQAELLQVFQEDLTVSGGEAEKEEDKADEALDIVKDEEEEAHKMEDAAEQKEEQLNSEVYADEDDDYDEADIMPDEENDLSESAI